MKALTLTQPWATLIALGQKRIETRDWYTPYRGPIAIHAAKGQPDWAAEFENDLWCNSMEDYGFELPRETPRGAIVAIAHLADVCGMTREMIQDLARTNYAEFNFGNWAAGRFAWRLTDIRPLATPIPARGQLGLWEWDENAAPITIAVPNPQMRLAL